MGGTLVGFADAGQRVVSIALTRSQMSTYGDPVSREAEFHAACASIGCTGRQLDFVDQEFENTAESRRIVARVIREHRPKIVFAPYHTNPVGELGGVANRDHFTAGSLVRDAVKLARLERAIPDLPKHTVKRMYFYMLPHNVTPDITVDVTNVMERAFTAIRCYQSQMAIAFRGNAIEETLRANRRTIGLIAGTTYAEGFVSDVPFQFAAKTFFEV